MTKIQFELDGKQVEAIDGETIWQVAKRQGREIPHLCYSPEPDYRPDGNCRACMVEVEGERVLAASCIRTPTAGMKVKSQSDRAKTARKMVFELLISDQPDRDTQAHAERRHEGEIGEPARDCRTKDGDGASGRRSAGARDLTRS